MKGPCENSHELGLKDVMQGQEVKKHEGVQAEFLVDWIDINLWFAKTEALLGIDGEMSFKAILSPNQSTNALRQQHKAPFDQC